MTIILSMSKTAYTLISPRQLRCIITFLYNGTESVGPVGPKKLSIVKTKDFNKRIGMKGVQQQQQQRRGGNYMTIKAITNKALNPIGIYAKNWKSRQESPVIREWSASKWPPYWTVDGYPIGFMEITMRLQWDNMWFSVPSSVCLFFSVHKDPAVDVGTQHSAHKTNEYGHNDISLMLFLLSTTTVIHMLLMFMVCD